MVLSRRDWIFPGLLGISACNGNFSNGFDAIVCLPTDPVLELGEETTLTVDGNAARREGAESLERLPGCGREDPDRVDKATLDVAGRGSLDGTVVFASLVGTGGRCRAAPPSFEFVVASRTDSKDRTLALASFILLEGDKCRDGVSRGNVATVVVSQKACRRGVGWRNAVAVVVACFGFGVIRESNRMVLVSEIKSGGDVAGGTLDALDDVDTLPACAASDRAWLKSLPMFNALALMSWFCPDNSLMLLGA
jgi:hypothetical protein